MRQGARAAAAVAALAAAIAPPAARAADEPAAVTKSEARDTKSQAYPLVMMGQFDAVLSADNESGVLGANPTLGDDPPDDSLVRIRRLRVGEDWSHGAWRVRTILEAASTSTVFTPVEGERLPFDAPLRVPEASVTWAPHRAYQLTAGAQRVPFTLSRQVDEVDLRLPERAQVFSAIAPDYRVGVAFTSDLGLLNLRIAGMSADTTLDADLFEKGFLGAARLSADPIGPMGVAPWRRATDDPWYGWWRFSAGLSVLYGTLLAPRTLGLGGDAQLQWRRFTVTGEYVGEYLTSGGGWPQMGAVVEPGVYLLSERLELVARGSWYRRPYAPPTGPAVHPDHSDTFAAGGGLTLFAHAAQIRLQAAFETRRTRDDLLSNSNWAIFRVTLAL
jgi:hypothetical protein